MSKLKYIALSTIALACSGTMLTSCDDYLTITPTNSIVEEEYWKDKKDLQDAVYACYGRLIKDDILRKYIDWGEVRSDNFTKRQGVNNNSIQNIMNANLLSTNYIFDWTCFYNEINYCNKILVHGPEIVASDVSFSDGDWQPIRAEALTLRALSHFWLLRTFGDIPYVTKDYNNDSQNFLIAQTPQIDVLNAMIEDLEIAKDIAMNDYGNIVDNKGRITKKSVRAILADVYLWRASLKAGNAELGGQEAAKEDYQKCIENCDWVIEQLKQDYIKQINSSGSILGGVSDMELSELFIQPYTTGAAPGSLASLASGSSYTAIFGSGNSRESIFELQFDGTNNANNMLNNYFWDLSKSVAGTLVCTSALMESVNDNPNSPIPNFVFSKTDYRRWETVRWESDLTEYPFIKYSAKSISQYNGKSSSNGVNNNAAQSIRDDANSGYYYEATERARPNSANFIMYRLSDVVLMKAEALTQIATGEEDMKTAFSLVREVFKRSNPRAYNNKPDIKDSLNFEAFNTQENMESLVLAERQREFYGEGKRWFDLVRYAQRHGSTTDMLKLLTRKYVDNKRAIEAKLATLPSLYSPIYTNQIKNNPLLKQNPVWGTTESSSRTDNL